MTPTTVIPSQSFLRTSTSATPSHKTLAFSINIAYYDCMFVPAELAFLRSCQLAYLFLCFFFCLHHLTCLWVRLWHFTNQPAAAPQQSAQRTWRTCQVEWRRHT